MSQERRGSAPCFHDGLQTRKTYLVIASKPQQEADKYNCIGIRNMGDFFRVHAYPSFEYFGVNLPRGMEPYDRKADINGIGYKGCHLSGQQVEILIDQLKGKRGVVVAELGAAEVVQTARGGFQPSLHATP